MKKMKNDTSIQTRRAHKKETTYKNGFQSNKIKLNG